MTETTPAGPASPIEPAAAVSSMPDPPVPATDPAPAAARPPAEASPITRIKPSAEQGRKPRLGRALAIVVVLLIILAGLFFVYHRRTKSREGSTEAPSATQAKPQDDALRLEGELNHALREAGFSGVTTAVGDDGEVTLTGTVGTERDKKKAFALVESFKGVGTVKDMVFVVEQ